MPRATRRSALENYRDILLAIKNTDGKVTRIMNYTGIAYVQLIKTLSGMIARKLIKMVEKEPDEKDKRSEYHFEIESKGDDVGKLLVELLDYLEDEEPPDLRTQPPVVILRQIMILRGLTFERPKEVLALPQLESSELEAEKVEAIHVHRGWYDCPRCGTSIPTYKGLKMHITKKHPEEKEELHEQIKIRYEGRAPAL